jgi:hypothetical protein
VRCATIATAALLLLLLLLVTRCSNCSDTIAIPNKSYAGYKLLLSCM